MKLPPLNALRAFEAVSRHGSVSKAAEELCVSQGAVSQQLRNLEDYFGKTLFDRGPNSFALTEEAETFAGAVQQSFEQITAAARGIVREKSQHTLRISAPPTLTIKWLMPRFGDFYEKHPGIAVVMDESLELVTFKNDGFDGAIRFGNGRFDNLTTDHMITIRGYAVASPAYIEKHGRPESIRNPRGHYLIDYYSASKSISAQHIHWQDIIDGDLEAMDIEHRVYPDDFQSLTATVQGQGIGLCSRHMIDDEIETGRLVLLSDEPLYEYCNRYYFVSPGDARPNPALDAFRGWLTEISRPYRDT